MVLCENGQLATIIKPHSSVTSSFEYEPIDGASAPRIPSEGQSVRKQVQTGREDTHAWRTSRARGQKERWDDWPGIGIRERRCESTDGKVLVRDEFKEREEVMEKKND